MTRINLLPWREELRQERQKQFMTLLVLTIILAAAIVGLIHFQMNSKIDYQSSRNDYLSKEISKLDNEIAEISELQKVRKSLVERMDIIQDLQASRPSIVHLFTEIVSTVPNGVFIKSLEQNNNTLKLTGEAESNARVSSYMRNLSNSEWLEEPNLEIIEILDKKVSRISTFVLTVKQANASNNEEEEDTLGGKK
ncbi:MAG: PilN domain-containing protein [Gammaproteobacteria bacterium]|jgi:type IV pilus assembly protein PilN|nr:PilN domain-containing protein [Gammaproteobacteria bacterium]MBT3722733.1 PilN domain-containing protein [Gammaproteobacteria bacterium]MBT4077693.1 PilN domain-containing protein [Gammaproteobacteria bacterium]MBT4196143.1 PilN domain-containing protein [Gammaproteobacteria bacterium]MBT4448631.1 PilN domain-containing protein [Gammaproteobacteria bacterium]